MWQLRGLALNPRIAGGTRSTGRGLKLAIEPRRGLLVCNGRPGHLQVIQCHDETERVSPPWGQAGDGR